MYSSYITDCGCGTCMHACYNYRSNNIVLRMRVINDMGIYRILINL